MVGNIMSFGKLVERAGLGKIIKYIPQYSDELGRFGIAIFENGTKGTFNVLKGENVLRQTIKAGGKEVSYSTLASKVNFQSIFNGTREVKIPQTQSLGYIKDLSKGKVNFASNYTRTPFSPNPKIVNGKIKYTVPSLQELHTNTLVDGKLLMPEDRLISGDGKFLKIFQREPKFANNINVNELSSNHFTA